MGAIEGTHRPAMRWRRGAGAVLALLAALAAWMLLRTGDGASTTPRTGEAAATSTTAHASAQPRPVDGSPSTGTGEGADADIDRAAAIEAEALRRHLERVLLEGDPRQRLVALRMLTAGRDDLATRRRARAEAARLHAEAPDDPLIAMAQTWFCGGDADPCTAAELDAWARTEPGNGAVHLDALQRAQGRSGEQDALLRRMASASRQDIHMHALMLETAVALDGYVPPPATPALRARLRELGVGDDPASRRRLVAAGYAWAMPYPQLQGLPQACRPPLSAARERDCRSVLVRMARAPTQIERRLAYSLLERLTRGTAEGAHWALALRRQQWWLHQFATLETGEAYWNDLLRHGEIGAMQRALVRAGRPLDPPAGWRPPGY